MGSGTDGYGYAEHVGKEEIDRRGMRVKEENSSVTHCSFLASGTKPGRKKMSVRQSADQELSKHLACNTLD